MKRAIIGGFVALIGSIWMLALSVVVANNLVSAWRNPPGLFLTTVAELDLMPLFVASILLVVLGIALMVVAYFEKER